LFVPFSTAEFAVGFSHGYFRKKVKMVDKNERSKQDEEGQIKIKIMMRRAQENRYSSITFWSLHFDGPFKNYYRDIAISHYLAFFFRKKSTLTDPKYCILTRREEGGDLSCELKDTKNAPLSPLHIF
jgi:hypothetical protein